MLRQEELVQQPIDLQQAVPIQPDQVAVGSLKAPIPQSLERLGKPLGQFDSKFLPEISAANLAQLELQDEFADQPLVVVRGQRPPNRQLTRFEASQVRLEISMVLVMRPADVPESRTDDRCDG